MTRGLVRGKTHAVEIVGMVPGIEGSWLNEPLNPFSRHGMRRHAAMVSEEGENWELTLRTALAQGATLVVSSGASPDQLNRIDRLEHEVASLKKEMLALKDSEKAFVVPIQTFGVDSPVLKRRVEVVVQPNGEDDYIATFFDANISASGDTADDAIDSLKATMLAMFSRFQTEDKLGPLPAKQLAVLREFIG